MSRPVTSRATVRPPTSADVGLRFQPAPPVVDGEILTMAAIAVRFGMPNSRAVRDFCQKHGVPYRRDGKRNWVIVADFKRAIERLPTSGVGGSQHFNAVDAAVAIVTGGW